MPQATIQPTSEDHDQFDDDDDDDDNLFESAAAAHAAAAQTAAAQTAAAERTGSTDVSRIPELRVSLNPINRLVKGGGSTHPTPHRTQRMLLAVLPQCCGLNAWMVPQRVLGSVLISASMEQNENRRKELEVQRLMQEREVERQKRREAEAAAQALEEAEARRKEARFPGRAVLPLRSERIPTQKRSLRSRSLFWQYSQFR
mgnify:CR=1 FL=1